MNKKLEYGYVFAERRSLWNAKARFLSRPICFFSKVLPDSYPKSVLFKENGDPKFPYQLLTVLLEILEMVAGSKVDADRKRAVKHFEEFCLDYKNNIELVLSDRIEFSKKLISDKKEQEHVNCIELFSESDSKRIGMESYSGDGLSVFINLLVNHRDFIIDESFINSLNKINKAIGLLLLKIEKTKSDVDNCAHGEPVFEVYDLITDLILDFR